MGAFWSCFLLLLLSRQLDLASSEKSDLERCQSHQPAYLCAIYSHLERDTQVVLRRVSERPISIHDAQVIGSGGHASINIDGTFEVDDFGKATGAGAIASKLEVSERLSVPDTLAWSRCFNCGFDVSEEKFHFLGASKSNAKDYSSLQATWSQWGEFFFEHHQDAIQLEFSSAASDAFRFTHIIDRPVYILPIITFHVGHILIDLLEQLYHSMMSSYGEIRLDSLIVIDVAGSDERHILQEKLFINVEQSEDNIGNILRLFSSLPILSLSSFKLILSDEGRIPGVLFKDVHFGLDNSKSFFNVGHAYHPCIFNLMDNPFLTQLSLNYKKFRDYTWNLYNYKETVDRVNTDRAILGNKRSTKILFVQRESNRVITNLNDIIRSVCNSSNPQIQMKYGTLVCVSLDLNKVSLKEQMKHFSDADVLVAVAGTALHNLIFLQPKTAVIIIMQPGWCDFAWMYANQAILLSIKPFIYCDNKDSAHMATSNYQLNDIDEDDKVFLNYMQSSLHWTRNFNAQGPRMTKGSNISLGHVEFLGVAAMSLDFLKGSFSDGPFTCSGRLENAKYFKKGAGMGEFVAKDIRSTNTRNNNNNSSSIDFQSANHNTNANDEQTLSQGDNSSSLFNSFAPSLPIVRIFISELQTTNLPGDLVQISFIGELVGDFRALESLSRIYGLSLCMKSIYTYMEPWCYAMDALNYLSMVKLALSKEVLCLHLWLQLSAKGHTSSYTSLVFGESDGILTNGKLKGSDNVIALDLRLPNAGFDIHTQIRQEFYYDIIDSNLEKHVFFANITDKFSIQRISNDFCAFRRFSYDICAQFVQGIYRVLYQTMLLNEIGIDVQNIPSPKFPFVFLHIEKTAGTTLRELITESADALALDYIVPCHKSLSCATFKISDLDEEDKAVIDVKNASIMAGHFAWGEWQSLPTYAESEKEDLVMELSPANKYRYAKMEREKNRISDQGASISTPFILTTSDNSPPSIETPLPIHPLAPPCFIIGRHPINRAISYYYQRCYNSSTCPGYRQRISDISSDDLDHFLLVDRVGGQRKPNALPTIFDDGISDSMCRVLSNTRVTTGRLSAERIYVPPGVSPEDRAFALNNVDSCIIGLQERWEETMEVLNHWFPWINTTRNPNRRKMQIYSGKESMSDLKQSVSRQILDLNKCDLAVYEKMVARFDKQLEALRASGFSNR